MEFPVLSLLTYFPVLSLPLEIREIIWEFALALPEPPADFDSIKCETFGEPRKYLSGLLGASKQLRQETFHIFYGQNTFYVDARFRSLPSQCRHSIAASIRNTVQSLTISERYPRTSFLKSVKRHLPHLKRLSISLRPFADIEMVTMLSQLLHERLGPKSTSPTVTVVLGLTRTDFMFRVNAWPSLRRDIRLSTQPLPRPPASQEVVLRATVKTGLDIPENWEQFTASGWDFVKEVQDVEHDALNLHPYQAVQQIKYTWHRVRHSNPTEAPSQAESLGVHQTPH